MGEANPRQYWLETMLTIGRPVLEALAQRKLKATLPVDFHPERRSYAPLEAFGRLACGMAPWLELSGLDGEEERLRSRYADLLLAGFDAATDPASPDYMDFASDGQPLVDAAFVAHALVRAPNGLAAKLDERVKRQLIAALQSTRRIVPGQSNWLLFSAMVEAGLYLLGDPTYDRVRVDYAVQMFMQWYKGDGIYGDGAYYRWDYYNSFVIQPMLVDVVALFAKEMPALAAWQPVIMARAGRYASVLEKMIAPDGTYPIVGRSAVYRFGAFQLLAQAALQHFLDERLPPAQVRCALTAVIRRIMACPGNFDEAGWLRPGVYGYQPELAESYINTGSLYLCAAVFLPLGLAPSAAFWSGPEVDWSSRKLVAGTNVPADRALQESGDGMK